MPTVVHLHAMQCFSMDWRYHILLHVSPRVHPSSPFQHAMLLVVVASSRNLDNDGDDALLVHCLVSFRMMWVNIAALLARFSLLLGLLPVGTDCPVAFQLLVCYTCYSCFSCSHPAIVSKPSSCYNLQLLQLFNCSHAAIVSQPSSCYLLQMFELQYLTQVAVASPSCYK